MAAPKKLTPAMQRLVNALNEHGHIDPIRDCGRHTGTNTIVALMHRGILREAKHHRGIHHPATTPEQVWDEAHAEDAWRTAERTAAQTDPERWSTGREGDHIRRTRTGGTLHVHPGYSHWLIELDGKILCSAAGDFQEARAAADRSERELVHAEALNEYREATRADREADSAAYQRELARDLGLNVKGDPQPEPATLPQTCGRPWVAEIELCPRCGLSAAEHPRHVGPAAALVAQMLGSTAARRALHAYPLDDPETLVHAFGRDIYAASTAAACGGRGVRGPADTVTCPACRELLAQRAQTIAEAEAEIAALTPAPSAPWAADTAVINGELAPEQTEGGDGFKPEPRALSDMTMPELRTAAHGYGLPVDRTATWNDLAGAIERHREGLGLCWRHGLKDCRACAAAGGARRMQHRDVNDPIARIVREHLNALDVAAIHHGSLVRDLQDAVGDLIRRAMAEAAAPNH